jgi:chemotaxis protein histidine kinase CheA
MALNPGQAAERPRAELPKGIADKLSAMRGEFVQRAQGQGMRLSCLASELARPADDRDISWLLHCIEQSAHSLHGSGGTFGFDVLSDAAGALEELVSQANAVVRQVDESQAVAAVLRAIDRVLSVIPRTADPPRR